MALSGLENPAFKLENEIQENEDRQRGIRVEGKQDEDEDNALEDCNCFGKSLAFFNRLRNPKWCLVFLSIGALIQGKVFSRPKLCLMVIQVGFMCQVDAFVKHN